MTRQTRHHSCGEPLNSVQRYEVIPAGLYVFGSHAFTLSHDGEHPDLVIEDYRCNYCGELLDHGDKRWVMAHLPPDFAEEERLAA
jgi:hypothetical protein